MNRLPRDSIVHQSAHVVLEHICQLIDQGLVNAFLHLLFEEVVVLDDSLVAVSQVVLGPHR